MRITTKLFLWCLPWFTLAGFLYFHMQDAYFIQNLRLKTFDFYQKSMPRVAEDVPVYVIDVDEKSLAEYGQWPWPRSLIADLVDAAYEQGVKALGMDVVFAEPDGKSPENVVEGWQVDEAFKSRILTLPSNDMKLAAAYKKHNVVAGYSFHFDQNEPVDEEFVPLVGVSTIGPVSDFLVEAGAVVRNLKLIEGESPSMGWFGYYPDSDNIIRRAPTLVKYGENIYPSLAMEVFRQYLGTKRVIAKADETGLQKMAIGKTVIPVDAHGNFWLHFRPSDKANYISAADVLKKAPESQKLDGAMALVGTSAIGLFDMRTTPLTASAPGVDIHAQLLESFVQGAALSRTSQAKAQEFVLMAVGGALMIVMIQLVGALWSFLIFAGLVGGCVVLSIYFFQQGYLYDVSSPLLVMVSVFMVQNFVKYLLEESSKKAIRDAFSHYLSSDMVKIVSKNPEALTLGGELKEMTVLFSDIRSFTSLSEGLTPEQLTNLLNRYLTPMTGIVQEHQGTIDKYIGDALMAFWNAPLDTENHAEKACASALDMLAKLKELNLQFKSEGLPELAIGIGVNTAEVSVGNMGSDQRFDYTVMGDGVNLASRLEGLCKLYGVEIVVSAAVKGQVPNGLFAPLDFVAVKGKKDAVEIYQLLAVDAEFADEKLLKQAQLIKDAIASYRGQLWDQAEHYLDQIEGYGTFKSLYQERIDHYRQVPPPSDWSGVFIATSK